MRHLYAKWHAAVSGEQAINEISKSERDFFAAPKRSNQIN